MQRLSFLALFVLLAACVPPTAAPATLTPPPTLPPGAEIIPLSVGYGLRDGPVEVYFTDPLNPLSATDTGGPDARLVQAIDEARLSIDMAIYSLSLASVRDALIRAHRRGVTVRVVAESDNRDRSAFQALEAAGIPVLGDRREGLMHNKFIVIDRAEVWTGSLNFTTDGTYEDANNLVRIRSTRAAENYTTEFEEMFVRDLFGPDALAATPNPRLTVDGIPLEFYFAPDDRPARRIVELINGATRSIYFMAYSFTSDEIAQAILARARDGVTVAGIMDAEQARTNLGTEFDVFRQAGLDVRRDGEAGLMHHKVIVIDEAIVITGSYNFTRSAETRNDENLVVIADADIAAFYLQEFDRLFALTSP